MAHSITGVWRSNRDTALSKGAGIAGFKRDTFEKCAAFVPGRPPEGINLCSNEQLLHLYGNWIDWPRRGFVRSTLREVDNPAMLSDSNLLGANFDNSDASGIGLTRSILFRAAFSGTNLKRASLAYADLRRAELSDVDLGGASLAYADLRDAKLRNVNLGGASFTGANLDGVLYEPAVGQLPDLASLAGARNLQGLRWEATSQQLNELREAFYKAGLPERGQQITFAIERSRRVNEGRSADPVDQVLSWGRRIAFEWTADYGLKPFKPLLILVILIPLFAPVYLAGSGHLWISRPDKAINRPSRGWLPLRRVMRGDAAARLLRYLWTCLWFSTVCAFRIGYRDVNVGDWITRLQPREYLLGATGWCRTVSGLQSLVSVYLLALTVLCIIGRPFG
jgi:uncharacterized protein YjbI with pentapeptide repeats